MQQLGSVGSLLLQWRLRSWLLKHVALGGRYMQASCAAANPRYDSQFPRPPHGIYPNGCTKQFRMVTFPRASHRNWPHLVQGVAAIRPTLPFPRGLLHSIPYIPFFWQRCASGLSFLWLPRLASWGNSWFTRRHFKNRVSQERDSRYFIPRFKTTPNFAMSQIPGYARRRPVSPSILDTLTWGGICRWSARYGEARLVLTLRCDSGFGSSRLAARPRLRRSHSGKRVIGVNAR